MYTYLALPCRGHLEQIFHVFGYLKVNPKIKLCFDPQQPSIDERSFAAHDWYDFYRDAKEAIVSDAPTPEVMWAPHIVLWMQNMMATWMLVDPRPGS